MVCTDMVGIHDIEEGVQRYYNAITYVSSVMCLPPYLVTRACTNDLENDAEQFIRDFLSLCIEGDTAVRDKLIRQYPALHEDERLRQYMTSIFEVNF